MPSVSYVVVTVPFTTLIVVKAPMTVKIVAGLVDVTVIGVLLNRSEQKLTAGF